MRPTHILLLCTAFFYVASLDVYITGPVRIVDCREERYGGPVEITTHTHSSEGVPVNETAICSPSCTRGICLRTNTCGCSPTKTRKQCESEFWHAAKEGNQGYVVQALSSNINPNCRNEDNGNGTALYAAAESNKPSIVRAILEAGGNPEMRNDKGWTPLYIAARIESTTVVNVLLDHGVDVNVRTNAGTSPLMIAAYRGHVSVAEALLDAGADVNLVKTDGTALHFAAERNHPAMARFLLGKGADKTKLDKYGDTPAASARYFDHYEVARIIENY